MREMGVLLRGGAVILVPLNFTVLCMLAADERVRELSPTVRSLVVAVVGVVYLGVHTVQLWHSAMVRVSAGES